MSCFVLDSNFVSFANLGIVFIHHMFISVVSGSGGKDSIVKTIGRVIYCTEEAILQKHRNISMFLSWEILPKKRNRGKDASLQGPLIITNISRFLS